MRTSLKFIFSALVISIKLCWSQVALPAPDKDGWIRLFRGNNFQDWYFNTLSSKPPVQDKRAFTATGDPFRVVKGDTILSEGNPSGHLYFRQSFSHYRVRYEMHFPGVEGNCGMLIHVQENDSPQVNFPVSIESQGDPGQGMGQIWCIGNLWVSVRADSGIAGTSYKWRYNATGKEIVTGGASWDSKDREVDGLDGYAKPKYSVMSAGNGWALQEADVHGGDSISHIVGGVTRVKYRDPRISTGGKPNNVSKHIKSGLLAWQSEGTPVWYRNIAIRLYPGDPLYQPVYAAWNESNTIRPKAAPKLLLVSDGTLTLRWDHTNRPSYSDLNGRVLTKITPLP